MKPKHTRTENDKLIDNIIVFSIAALLVYGMAWMVGTLLAYHAGR